MSKKHAIKSISLLWMGSLIGAGCAFLTQVILARQLGPSDFGIFSAALATTNLLAPLAGFGIAAYWLKVFGEEGWKATRWLKGSFKFVILSTLAVLLLLVSWALFGPNDTLTTTLLLILTIYILGQVAIELVSSKLQLEENYIHLAFWQFSPHLARLLLVGIIIYTMTNLVTSQIIAYIYAGVSLLFLIIGSIFLFRMYQGSFSLVGHKHTEEPIKEDNINSPSILQVASQSWPFGLAGIFYLIYFQSDIILLKYLSSAESAGIYNVAFVIMAAVYLFPSVVYQKFLLPKIHRWANHARTHFYHIYRIGNIWMVSFGLIAMFSLWIILPWFIPFLFGPEYHDAIKLLIILSFAVPIRFLATSIGSTLVTQDHMRKKVKYMGIVALLNIILNIILIPVHGAIGAAITTVFSDIVLLLLYYTASKKYVFIND
jgi:O-antigen/teichoic acid export membrane protein